MSSVESKSPSLLRDTQLPRLRIDQILSRFGYCSRSEAKTWLKQGRVGSVSGPLTDPAVRVDPSTVLIDGQPVLAPAGLVALFHKPHGYTCSHDDRDGRTIYELLPAQWSQRNPPVTSVGRLDKDTTGLLVLTDLGTVVHHFTSPRSHVEKVYEVETADDIPPNAAEIFSSGNLWLEGETKPCLPAHLEYLGRRSARLTLHEGRFHQVKRMFASQGAPVTRLHRTRVGSYELGNLKPGEWQLIAVPEDC